MKTGLGKSAQGDLDVVLRQPAVTGRLFTNVYENSYDDNHAAN